MSFADKMKNKQQAAPAADKATEFFMKDIPEVSTKTKRISVLAPEPLFDKITAAAKEKGLTKNAFILMLINRELSQ